MVLKILQDGGPVMIVILLLSFVALVLIIERFLYFRKIEKNEKRFLEAIFPLLETRDFQSAEKLCARYSCPVAEMTKAGLLNRRLSSEEIKEAMEIRAEAEVPKMERFVGALGTIANIAPLLGLLGTVTGNIKAFGLLGSSGVAADPALLASAIGEALYTTAAGIIVGVPAVFFYNLYISRINRKTVELETQINAVAAAVRNGGGLSRSL